MTWHCVNAQNREIAKRSVIEDAIVGIAISLSANAWVTVAIDLNTVLSAPWSISCVHSSWLLIISLSDSRIVELRIINKKSRQREILSRDTSIRNKFLIYVCYSILQIGDMCVCNRKTQIRWHWSIKPTFKVKERYNWHLRFAISNAME